MNRVFSICILLSVTCVALAQNTPGAATQPTIFVAPLDGDPTQIIGWQPALGEGLAEMLVTELGKLGKFQVVESTALKELADEIKLGEAGYVNEQERVEKGGWSGADFMFRGKVTRFGSNQKGVGLGGFVPRNFGNLGLKLTTSDVRIDWRIVDVHNRRVLKAGQAVGSHKGTGFDIGANIGGRGGNIGFENHEFMNSALGKATVKAVETIMADVSGVSLPESGRRINQAQIAQQVQGAAQAAVTALRGTPGKVLAVVNKSTLIVSLGSNQGFKNGDKLKVYEALEIKDDKGVVVFTEEKLAGEMTLDAVQEDRSKGTFLGSAEVKSGWTVKAQ